MNDVSFQFVLRISILWSQLFRVSWYVFRLGAFRNQPSWHWVPLNHISVQHLPQNHGLSDTPWKINMEPKNHLIFIEKENHLPFTSMLGFQPLIFQGPKGMTAWSSLGTCDVSTSGSLQLCHRDMAGSRHSLRHCRTLLESHQARCSCFLFVTEGRI